MRSSFPFRSAAARRAPRPPRAPCSPAAARRELAHHAASRPTGITRRAVRDHVRDQPPIPGRPRGRSPPPAPPPGARPGPSRPRRARPGTPGSSPAHRPGPTNTSCPPAVHRTRSPVRYTAHRRRRVERVSDKPLRGQPRPPEHNPAPGLHPATYSSPDTPGATGRSRSSSTNTRVFATGRPTGTTPHPPGHQPGVLHPDGRLGRPVVVDHRRPGAASRHTRTRPRRRASPPTTSEPPGSTAAPARAASSGQVRGHQLHHIDVLRPPTNSASAAGSAPPSRRHHHRPPASQRNTTVLPSASSQRATPAPARPATPTSHAPRHVVRQPAVRDRHALRHPGRPRRVHHIRQLPALDRRPQHGRSRHPRPPRPPRVIQHQHRHRPGRQFVAAPPSVPTTTAARASASMNAIRSAGTPDRAAGTRPRPSTPPAPPRPSLRPAAGTTPPPLRARAPPHQIPAPAGRPRIQLPVGHHARRRTPPRPRPGVRAACAANSSGTGPGGSATAVSFHPASSCRRSAGVEHLDRGHPQARIGGHRLQHPHQPRPRSLRPPGVEQVRRAVHRTAQPGRATARAEHLASRHVQVEPGHPRARGHPLRAPRAGPAPAAALFWTVSTTWNRGWRASDRAGASSSTSRSNGTSWCANAARPLSRTRPSSSANDGSPSGPSAAPAC